MWPRIGYISLALAIQSGPEDAVLSLQGLQFRLPYREDVAVDYGPLGGLGHRMNKGLPALAPACVVGLQGELDLLDVPELLPERETVNVTLGAKDLQIAASPYLPADVYELWRISSPFETFQEMQTCFRLEFYSPTTHVVLCASTVQLRSTWMMSLYKAVFCFNSGRPEPILNLAEGGEVVLPQKSTKDERWASEHEAMEEEIAEVIEEQETGEPIEETSMEDSASEEVNRHEIVLEGVQEEEPVVIVDGEDILVDRPEGF